MIDIIDTSEAAPSVHVRGEFVQLNFGYWFGARYCFFWTDSDGTRSDKSAHFSDVSFLLSEIDRLWMNEAISREAAIKARQLVWSAADSKLEVHGEGESFWRWIVNIVRHGM